MLQIPDWIDLLAAVRPNDAALVTPRVTLTFGQLRAASVAAAFKLEEQGIKRGQKVAVQSVSPALQLVMLLALHRLGVATCVLPHEPVRRRAGLEAIKFHFLLTDNDEKISKAKVLPIDLEWLAALELTAKMRPGGFKKPDDLSLISISSGTTSAPKPMGFSAGLLEKRVAWRSLGDEASPRGEKVIILAGLGAMNGILALLGVLWCGGTAYMGWMPEAAPDIIAQNRIDRLFCSAFSLFRTIETVEAGALDLSSLKQIHAGGDFISADLVRRVAKRMCANIFTDFGTNEAGRIALTAVDPARFIAREAGFLCPWAEAEAVDDKDRVLPPGQEGHLRFRSPLSIPFYLDAPEATAKRFRKGWFYSDDIGWVTPERALVISGRAADFIHAKDGRFNPVHIDHAYAGCPGIADAAGFGMPGAPGRDEIWLALVPRAAIDDAQLRDYGAEKLGARAPRHFLRLPQLPRNEAGKMVRSRLVELASQAKAQA